MYAQLSVRLSAISEAAERTVEAVRRIALSLRPSMLDDLGLVAAIEWQAREVGNRTGLGVEVCAEDSAGEMPDAQRTCIYRVTQEALHNCVRHAGAERCAGGTDARCEIADAPGGGQRQRLSRRADQGIYTDPKVAVTLTTPETRIICCAAAAFLFPVRPAGNAWRLKQLRGPSGAGFHPPGLEERALFGHIRHGVDLHFGALQR